MNEPKHRSPFVLVGRLIVLVKPMLPIMLAAIVMGVAGILLLLCLIPLVKGLK